MSENRSTLVTDAGEVPDWLEIMNAGNVPVEIGGYALLLDCLLYTSRCV